MILVNAKLGMRCVLIPLHLQRGSSARNVLKASFRLRGALSARIVWLERSNRTNKGKAVLVVRREHMLPRQGRKHVQIVQRASIPQALQILNAKIVYQGKW